MSKKMTVESGQSYEAMTERLNAVVEEMEKGKPALERNIELFEEGMALIKACEAMLDKATEKVKILTETGETVLFEGENDV